MTRLSRRSRFGQSGSPGLHAVHPPHLHLTTNSRGTFTRPAARRSRRVSSPPMCEHFVARAAEPFRLDEVWPFTDRLERYGMAGFGWGVAWLTSERVLDSHRDVRAFRDDPAVADLGAVETTSLPVHLRRPSKLPTPQLADTQPFADPGPRFAFSHNRDRRLVRHGQAVTLDATGTAIPA